MFNLEHTILFMHASYRIADSWRVKLKQVKTTLHSYVLPYKMLLKDTKLRRGKEMKDRNGFCAFISSYYNVHNINIRMDLTSKQKLEDYIGQFKSLATNLTFGIKWRDQNSYFASIFPKKRQRSKPSMVLIHVRTRGKNERALPRNYLACVLCCIPQENIGTNLV